MEIFENEQQKKNLIFKKISKHIKNSEIARRYYLIKWLNRLTIVKMTKFYKKNAKIYFFPLLTFWGYIHNTLFSSQLKNGRSKLERYVTLEQ